jgi:HlyD family secretion protein
MSQLMDRKINRSWWRRPPVVIGGGVAAAVLAMAVLAALSAGARASVRVPAQTVTVERASLGVFRDVVPLRGKVVPKDIVHLATLEGGQVEKVMVQPGDMVVVGQPLIRFRNTQLELEVLDREGRLVESITQLQSYEKQLEDTRVANEKAAARIEYDIVRLSSSASRRDALLAKGFVAREQHQAVHDELAYNRRLKPLQDASNRQQDTLRRRQLPQIQSELASLQESLKITRSKLDNLILRAPVAGRLTEIEQNIGQIRNRGERLGQIVPDTGVKVQAQIDEYYLARMRPGLAGKVEIGGREWPLTVTRVDPQVKDATFVVELAFVGRTPPGLLPGQTLDGHLSLGGDAKALVLPAGPFLERTGGDWAMVLASDHRAEKRRIRVGRRSAEQVEILGGLKPGERVITSDYTGFEKVDRVVLTGN